MTDPRSPDDVGTDEFAGRFYRPLGPPPHPGVLVVHGSDPDAAFPDEYARRLAAHGYATLRITYVGEGAPAEEFAEIPLAQFEAAIDWLVDRESVPGDRVGVVAWSRGTEAALLLAERDPRVGAFVGYVPSAYVFPALPDAGPETSAWSDGAPVPCVPPYEGIEADEDDPAVVRFRRTVERASEAVLERAALPIDAVDGPVLLVSGERDRIWPSTQFAETLLERGEGGITHCAYPDAGHAIAVPYEPIEDAVLEYMGGTPEGTAHAAADAWERALGCLRRGIGVTD